MAVHTVTGNGPGVKRRPKPLHKQVRKPKPKPGWERLERAILEGFFVPDDGDDSPPMRGRFNTEVPSVIAIY